MLDFRSIWPRALPYGAFLEQYGSSGDRARWDRVAAQVQLTGEQTQRLAEFRRPLRLLCMAGAWCGDCAAQCPVIESLVKCSPVIQLRFFDRDAEPAAAAELKLCGSPRIPQVVFLDEDFVFCGRFGDRTLTKYRQLYQQATGAVCSTGIVSGADPVFTGVVSDWLDEIERVQCMLQTSPRLREKYGD